MFGIAYYQDKNFKLVCSVNSIEPSQTARMCMLAWLYTSGKYFSFSIPAGLMIVKYVIHFKVMARDKPDNFPGDGIISTPDNDIVTLYT